MFSFFDKAKEKAQCFVGAHDWSDWKYLNSESCQESRICRRSGCTKKETREQHIWGEWNFATDRTCQQIRTCTRCRQEQKGEEQHNWGDWKYVTFDSWQQYITRLQKIRYVLATRFEMGEVKSLCFDLGIDPENLAGETKSDKSRELVKNIELHHRVDALIHIATKMRPDIYWDEMEISGIGKVEFDKWLCKIKNMLVTYFKKHTF